MGLDRRITTVLRRCRDAFLDVLVFSFGVNILSDRPVNALYRGDRFAGYAEDTA
jgi:hypothetical protein